MREKRCCCIEHLLNKFSNLCLIEHGDSIINESVASSGFSFYIILFRPVAAGVESIRWPMRYRKYIDGCICVIFFNWFWFVLVSIAFRPSKRAGGVSTGGILGIVKRWHRSYERVLVPMDENSQGGFSPGDDWCKSILF